MLNSKVHFNGLSLFTSLPGKGHHVRLQARPPGELSKNGAAVPPDRGERQEGRQDPRL